jgi:hypothetical protein
VREEDVAWAPPITECAAREREVGTAHPSDYRHSFSRSARERSSGRSAFVVGAAGESRRGASRQTFPRRAWERGRNGSAGASPSQVTPHPSPTHHSPAPVHNLNNLDSENPPEIGASDSEFCSCAQPTGLGKNFACSLHNRLRPAAVARRRLALCGAGPPGDSRSQVVSQIPTELVEESRVPRAACAPRAACTTTFAN